MHPRAQEDVGVAEGLVGEFEFIRAAGVVRRGLAGNQHAHAAAEDDLERDLGTETAATRRQFQSLHLDALYPAARGSAVQDAAAADTAREPGVHALNNPV